MSATVLARNNVRILGSGSQALLFAHGFGCDQNMWRFITPAFEADYRIILFDYVGSGKSDLRAYDEVRYNSLNGYVQDVLEICSDLAVSQIIFVGHSVSSMIGMLASIQAPALFSRLIMIGPSPCYINKLPDYLGGFEREDIVSLMAMMEKNYIGWADYLAPAIMQNPDQPHFAKELNDSFCSTDPKIAKQFANVTFFSDNRNDLAKANTPSLILQCSDDIIAPVEVGQYIHSQLHGSILKVMKATGHCPHLSHPMETISLIKDYLHAPSLE